MGPAIRYTRVFTLLGLTFLSALVETFSQTLTDAVAKKPAPIKFVDLGATESCEFREGVRRFMIELSNNPGHQGYIINYGSNHEIGRRERLITNKIAFRHFDRSRITLVHGGFQSKPATELWVIPPGAGNPEISGGGQEPASVSSVSGPVVVREFSYVIEELVLDSVRREEEQELAKAAGPDQALNTDYEPSEENESSDTKPVVWYNTRRFEWVVIGIGDHLATTAGTTGMMIFYADDRRYDIAKVTSLVEEARNLLAKDKRIATSRLEVRFGGYRETPEVEFWILGPRDTYPRFVPDERCPDPQKK